MGGHRDLLRGVIKAAWASRLEEQFRVGPRQPTDILNKRSKISAILELSVMFQG
jgi:hypothetical protein